MEYQIAAQKSLQALTILNDCPHLPVQLLILTLVWRQSVLILHHGCDPSAHVARRGGLHSPRVVGSGWCGVLWGQRGTGCVAE